MLVLITGGSKNGKSAIAEKIIDNYNLPRFYIATMEPFSEEAHVIIERHRKMRAEKHFTTIEQYTDIHKICIPKHSAVLLECIGNLCANEMFSKRIENPTAKILYGIEHLRQNSEITVIVTSQVSEDGISYSIETMKYIQNISIINREITNISDIVIEAVYGIPVFLKGSLPL